MALSVERGWIELLQRQDGQWVYYYKRDIVKEPHGPFDSEEILLDFLSRVFVSHSRKG